MFRAYIIPAIFVAALIAVAAVRPEFVDVHSLLLILGGAFTVTLFSYSAEQLRDLAVAIAALFKERPLALKDHVEELSRLTRLFRLEGLKALETQESLIEDGFVRKGVSLLIDLENEETIRSALEQRLAEAIGRVEISRQILSTLGKLLPSFGLIGTLIGMVLLLRNIEGQDLGALTGAISLAVLGTLYGAVFSNIAVAPLAARLQAVAMEKETQMKLTIAWVLMLVRGDSAAAIANRLNGTQPNIETGVLHDRRWLPAFLSTQR
jgi:chemotaxis protein MotA